MNLLLYETGNRMKRSNRPPQEADTHSCSSSPRHHHHRNAVLTTEWRASPHRFTGSGSRGTRMSSGSSQWVWVESGQQGAVWAQIRGFCDLRGGNTHTLYGVMTWCQWELIWNHRLLRSSLHILSGVKCLTAVLQNLVIVNRSRSPDLSRCPSSDQWWTEQKGFRRPSDSGSDSPELSSSSAPEKKIKLDLIPI